MCSSLAVMCSGEGFIWSCLPEVFHSSCDSECSSSCLHPFGMMLLFHFYKWSLSYLVMDFIINNHNDLEKLCCLNFYIFFCLCLTIFLSAVTDVSSCLLGESCLWASFSRVLRREGNTLLWQSSAFSFVLRSKSNLFFKILFLCCFYF